MENLEQSDNKNVSLSLIADYGSESESEETQSNENTGNDDSDAVELSEMVLKNNIINACAHGPLSANSESTETVTRHMIIDSIENDVVEYDVTEYRDADSESESSSDDSSDSDVDSVKDIDEISSGDEGNAASDKLETPKVAGELGLDDLPPIEDLAISLPAQETTKIGTIASIVDRLVIVRAFPQTPAVDLDSILFLENGSKALGKVFDVFGPVTEPHYCVRFNSQEHVKERGVETGMDVFIAPRSQQHTSYVFLSELMKVKGSDASWFNDVEPPPSQIEFSDDEEERRVRNAKKEAKKQNKNNEEGETSKNPPRKAMEKRSQRPSQSSSRFGGSSRGRFLPQGLKRNPTALFRSMRPWEDQGLRTPPPHPNGDPNGDNFTPPPFNPHVMPPFSRPYRNSFQFGRNPRMQPMSPTGFPHPFRASSPVFGSNFCNMSGPQPQWMNQPPPPGT